MKTKLNDMPILAQGDTKRSSCEVRVKRVNVGYEPKLMALMENKEKKPKKSRAAVAADAAGDAAGDADAMMQRLLEDTVVPQATGQRETLEGRSSGSQRPGGLLENLLPVGPPLTLAPKGSVDTIGTPRERVTRGARKSEQETPEVKRLTVGGDDRPGEILGEMEPPRPQTEPVHGAVSEHGTRENTGKGRGSGTSTRGVGSGYVTTHERQVGSRLDKTEHFYIGDSAVRAGETSTRVGDIVNPFWSRERQREALAGAGVDLSGHDVSLLGNLGSSQSTPQKDFRVEMDPIELFRLRCLRDAEERFRQGLLYMESAGELKGFGTSPGVDKGSMESQSSYVTATDEPEPFVPPPPPGPPPPSPPKISGLSGLGETPQPPPVLPPFPTSGLGSVKNSGGTGTNLGASGENPTESLRTMELPKLSSESTGLQFGDWLSIIDSMMGDLSYSSGEWWAMVRTAVDRCYQTWLSSSPLDRLRLKPTVDPKALLWPRTERRALSMLLGSIPEPIKEELISTRRLSTDQVLYKLCVTFQPGGASERTKILNYITDPKCGSSLQEVLEWIGMWRRQVQRAQELGLSLPDGLVLLGALGRYRFLEWKIPPSGLQVESGETTIKH